METEISIVIPVYREADRINGLIDHLRLLDRNGRCEIIVVDGDPSRGTIEVVRDGDVIATVAPKGRARQMNAGAALARSRVLLFLHADTSLPPDGIETILVTMDDPSMVGGAFSLRFDSPRLRHRVVAALTTVRSRITRTPFGDQAIFLRHDFFEQVGGYAPLPLMEDVDLMTRIRRAGGRVRIAPECVTTSSRRLESEGTFYCLLRGALLLSLFSLGVSPDRFVRFYGDGARPRPHRDGTHPGLVAEPPLYTGPIRRRAHRRKSV